MAEWFEQWFGEEYLALREALEKLQLCRAAITPEITPDAESGLPKKTTLKCKEVREDL